jgi:iron complex outermembrane receptor protein
MTKNKSQRLPVRCSVCCAVLSVWVAGPVQAQSGAEELPAVVVTAYKREQAAERVPAALSVISGDTLRRNGTESALNLGDWVPNLQAQQANGLQISIRGITSPDGSEKGDPSAAFHVDGVYRARAQSLYGSFFDLERVEVLRGPQGTLYGRNATAGVVDVVTMKPQPRLAARAAVGLGDHQMRSAEGMLNLPLNDQLALRVAVLRKSRDTELHNGQPSPYSPGGDQDERAARLQLLIRPEAGWRLLLAADEGARKGAAPTRIPATQFYDLSNPLNPVPVDRGTGVQTNTGIAPLLAPRQDNRQSGTSATFTVPLPSLGGAELHYQWAHRNYQRDEDGTQPLLTSVPGVGLVAVPAHVRWGGQYSQQSHELRLASTPGSPPWQWLTGLYAFSEDSDSLLYAYGLPMAPLFGWLSTPTHARSLAAFGQTSYAWAPTWRATLGLRHTRDSKSRVGWQVFQASEGYNPATDLRLRNEASRQDSKTTWRAGLEHDLAAHTLAYASWATGYKAGSFNDGCVAGSPGCNNPVDASLLYYRPETVQALELGLKTRLPAQRLQARASAFSYRYRDLQLNTVVGLGQVTRNAAQARVQGFELEVGKGLTAVDQLELSLAWLNARYSEFAPVPGVSWAGRQLDRAPRSTLGLAYQRTVRLDEGARLLPGLSVQRSSRYVISDINLPSQYTQPAFHKLNAQLAYVAPKDRWRLQAWGRNLNHRIVVSDYHPLGNVAIGEGRRWGVQLEASF